MPDWKAEIQRRLNGAAADPDVIEEMAQHLEQQFAELRVRVGDDRATETLMSQLDEQRLNDMPLRRSHGVPAVPLGAPRRGGPLAGMWQDLRFGARSLRRAPVFACVAVLSLAVGIGATTAIFSLLRSVLLERLAVNHPEQLVELQRSTGRGLSEMFLYREFEALKNAPNAPRLEATSGNGVTAVIGTTSSYPQAMLVSGGFFAMLGVHALIGRNISPEDERNHAPVVVVSQDLWETQLNADINPIGRPISLDGNTFTVIGVLPRSFRGMIFGVTFDIAVPLSVPRLVSMPPLDDPQRGPPLTLYARMSSGQTPAQAGATFDAAFQGCCALLAAPLRLGKMPGKVPNDPNAAGVRSHIVAVDASRGISNPKIHLREQYRQILLALMAGVSVLLLIACANVGNLLMARASARERELAVRISMGATRGRVVRQLLTESLELAIAGALLGLGLARVATSVLSHNLPPAAQMLSDTIAMRPSAPILGFTLGVSVMATLLFGIWPALRATRGDIMTPLKDGSRGSGRRMFADRAVVSAQVALALVLVCGAALFVQTLRNLRQVEGGESPRLLLGAIDSRGTVYAERGLSPLIPDLMARARTLSGVTQVSLSTTVPVFGGTRSRDFIRVAGFEPSDDADFSAWFAGVSSDYFATTGIAIERGRPFAETDVEGTERVAIVSRAFAKHFFNNRDPMGEMITLGNGAEAERLRIVGVARDAHYDDLRQPPSEIYYAPLAQSGGAQTLVITLRTSGDPSVLGPALRRLIEDVAPGLRVRRLVGFERALDDALARERLAAGLASAFGLVALGLAAVGLYGVVAYNVSRRTQEIGVRMALGARPADALWLVVRQMLTMTLTGVAVGVPLALLATSGVRAQLYGIGAHDPVPMTAAAVLLVVVGVVSSVVPARRAARVDPVVALRSE